MKQLKSLKQHKQLQKDIKSLNEIWNVYTVL